MRVLVQGAVSVAASLVATALYGVLTQQGVAVGTPGLPPPVTSGGKFAARLERPEALAPIAPASPTTTLVSWTVGPRASTASIGDPGWSAALDASGPPAPHEAPVRTAPRRTALHPAPAAAPALPPPRPAVLPQLDLHTSSPRDTGLWSQASSAALGVARSGMSLAAAGTALLGRLVP